MLIQDEGLKLKPYKCTAGKTSIGVGRNLDDVGITEPEAMTLLDYDLRRAEQGCLAIFGEQQWGRWSDVRKAGWINFCFNLGYARMLGFRNTLAAAIKEDWPKVEEGLRKSKWFDQVKGRAERVISAICKEEWTYD